MSPSVHLNIYLYYGVNREKNSNVIAQQDIVLTTYTTLAMDAKVEMSINKQLFTLILGSSVVECLTRDRGAASSSLTVVTALWSLSKAHLS